MPGMGKVILWVGDKEGRNWIGECIFDNLDDPRVIGGGFTAQLHPEEQHLLIAMAQRIHVWMPQDIGFASETCKPINIYEALWVWLEVEEGKTMSYRFIFKPPLPIYRNDNEAAPVQEG